MSRCWEGDLERLRTLGTRRRLGSWSNLIDSVGSARPGHRPSASDARIGPAYGLAVVRAFCALPPVAGSRPRPRSGQQPPDRRAVVGHADLHAWADYVTYDLLCTVLSQVAFRLRWRRQRWFSTFRARRGRDL